MKETSISINEPEIHFRLQIKQTNLRLQLEEESQPTIPQLHA